METAKGKNIRKIGEYCFWTALIIELLIVIVDKSAYINTLESQLFRLTFLLFCIKIICTKYSVKEWMCILFFGAVMFASYLINEKDEAVRMIALIASCKDMDIKKVMKVIFWVTAAGCLALVLLSITGIYGTISMTADFGRGGNVLETRHTFGMGHPNALHCMLWLVVVLAMYNYKDVLKWQHFAVFAILDFAVFFFTDSKTGFIVWLMSVIMIVVMKYSKRCRESRHVYFMGTAVILGCVIFSMIGAHAENTYFTPDSLMHKLDLLLNGRYQSAYAIEAARLENWKLFAAPENTVCFDAGFVRLFYWYGIIPGIIYIGMMLYLLHQSYREQDYALFVMLVVFSVYNLMEAHFISVYLLRNYLFVLMGHYWYQPFKGIGECEAHFWQVKRLIAF